MGRDTCQVELFGSTDARRLQVKLAVGTRAGFLPRLCELLLRHGLDVESGVLTTEQETSLVRFELCGPGRGKGGSPDAAQLLGAELEKLARDTEEAELPADWNAAALERLCVTPDLISVSSFREAADARGQRAYTMEVHGIRQAGLLAYLTLVLFRSGFTVTGLRMKALREGEGAPMAFQLTTAPGTDAHMMLRTYLDVPVAEELCEYAGTLSSIVGSRDHHMSSKCCAVPLDGATWSAFDDASDHRSTCASVEGSIKSASSAFVSPGDFFIKSDSTFFKAVRNRKEHEQHMVCAENGDVYQGECLPSTAGMRQHGFGTYWYSGQTHSKFKQYTGQWHEGKKQGQGVMLFRSGGCYAGEWADNRMHGAGVMHDYEKSPCRSEMPAYRFEGEWRDNAKEGLGVEETAHAVFFGRFSKDCRCGPGVRVRFVSGTPASCEAFDGCTWRPLLRVLDERVAGFAVEDARDRWSKASCEARRGSCSSDEAGSPLGLGDASKAPSEASGAMGPLGAPRATGHRRHSSAPSHAVARATAEGGSRRSSADGCWQEPVIASPALWSADQLAAFLGCLGIGHEAVRNVRQKRPRSPEHLVLATDSELRSCLGLSSAAERHVARRALKQLLELARQQNAVHFHAGVEAEEDLALSEFVLPWEELKVAEEVSSGGFGQVFRGVLRPKATRCMVREGQELAVAAKAMKGGRRTRLNELLKESRVMASLDHNNLCRFVGIVAQDEPGKVARHYVVSELMDCSLFDLVHKPHGLSWTGTLDIVCLLSIAEGVGRGVEHLHAIRLVHADLKSPNVLIDFTSRPARPTPKLCDFGHAALRARPAPHARCGTPHWASPEALRNEAVGPASDVFSWGALVWEMLSKKIPHGRLTFAQVVGAVGWAGWTPDMDMLPAVPHELRELLLRCWAFMPDERPSASAMCSQAREIRRRPRKEALRMLAGFLTGMC